MNSKAKNQRSANGRSAEEDRPAADADAAARRSFTAKKLIWLSALNAEEGLSPRAFKVGFAIAQCVNERTEVAFLSDETIRDMTRVPLRWIARARKELRDLGWLEWKRTQRENHYRLRHEKINEVLDQQANLRDRRIERRLDRRHASADLPQVANRKPRKLPQVAKPISPQVADCILPRVADIHLQGTTLISTPSKDRLSKGKNDSVCKESAASVEPPRPAAAIERPFPAAKSRGIAELELSELLGYDGLGQPVVDRVSDDAYEYMLDRLMLGELVESDLEDARRVAREAARGEP